MKKAMVSKMGQIETHRDLCADFLLNLSCCFFPLSSCSSTFGNYIVADEDIPDSARKPKESGDEAEEGAANKPAKKAPAKKRKADAEDGEGVNGAKDEEEEKPKKKRAVSSSACLFTCYGGFTEQED